MNLIVGATGILGGDICRRLHAWGRPVRAVVRPESAPARVSALQALGIETVQADLRDPASLAAACQGVEAVFSSATSAGRQAGGNLLDTDQQGQIHLVQAARQAGVKQFIYISYSQNIDVGPNPAPLTLAKRDVEQALFAAGLDYTILRPSYFMETWLSPAVGFDYANGSAVLYGSGHTPVSWISLADVARLAVQCLGHPSARCAVIECGGPQALSQREVVRIFEQVSAKTFTMQPVSEEALAARRTTATHPWERSLAALMLSLAHGDPVDPSFARTFNLPQLVSVQDYALRVCTVERVPRENAEIIQFLREFVDYAMDEVGSGRSGMDRVFINYVENSHNRLSQAFQIIVDAMCPWEVWLANKNSENVRRTALRQIAQTLNVPEVTRFCEALIESQDRRISLFRTLSGQAELLR